MKKSIKTALKRLCGDPKCARERLLHTAGMLYAERGLDAVSTRELTGEAGVNLAAIAYYFGGKDGLRDAVIDTVIERTRERVGPIVARLSRDVTEAGGDRRDLSRAAARFVRDYLGTTLPLGPENWTVTVVMRAMSTRSEAHDRLYDSVFAPMMNAVHQLTAAATGRDADDSKTRILATAILGEVLTFRRNRPMVMKSLDWDTFTPDRVDQILDVVTPKVLARLGLPLDAIKEPASEAV